jgi:sugar transferase (PEP-CTERM system associated)
MVKVLNQYFPGRVILLIFAENALIVLGVWVAVSLYLGLFSFALFYDPAIWSRALLISLIYQVCFYFNDLYDLKSLTSRLEIALRLLRTFGIASLVLAFLYLFVPETRLGSGVVEVSAIAIILAVLLWRVLVEWFNRVYAPGDRILIVGTGPHAQSLASQVAKRPDLHMQVMGLVSEDGLGAKTSSSSLACLGSLDGLDQIAAEVKPDRIVIAVEERRKQLPMDVLLRLRLRGTSVEHASALYEKLTGRIPIDSIQPSAVVFSEVFRSSVRAIRYRRAISAAGSLLGLVLLSPLMALIAIGIKLDSRGPVFYRQERVGLDGGTFEMLKFRSMRIDAESATGPVWAQKQDSRVTRAGRVLRKLRLDELPQLVNVFRGELNFIGPRPERPHFVKMLEQQIPFYDVRHVIRPGVTGWAQVSCPYGSTWEENKEKFEYDMFYLKNMSFSLDLVILFETLKIAMHGRGAR